MQEVIDLLTEDPERTAAMAYTGATATGLAYAGFKYDFGAKGMTNEELSNYLEDNSGLSLSPVALYKKHLYSSELETRQERNEALEQY